jgi:uncharacterized protein YcfJ
LEKERGNYLSQLRMQQAGISEGRKQTLEAGKFTHDVGSIEKAGAMSLSIYEKQLQTQQDSLDRIQAMSLDKQAALTKSIQDRYIREVEKRNARLTREAMEATNQANAKARKLGAWVQPVMGAAMGAMTGNPIAAFAGAVSGYATTQLANQGVTVPSLSYTDLSNIAKSSSSFSYFKEKPKTYTYDPITKTYIQS